MQLILAIILGIWLIGFFFHIAGGFIHLLLVLAFIIFLTNLFTKAS